MSTIKSYNSTSFINLSAEELVEHAIKNGEGVLSENGALAVSTGKYTGRSPKDRYIVQEKATSAFIHWGKVNIPFEEGKFEQLYNRMVDFSLKQKLYINDCMAGADPRYNIKIRVFSTKAWHSLFCHNMFITPDKNDLLNFDPEYTILCLPDFKADPLKDGTANPNFTIINLSKKLIIIGGTAYAGEIKKGVFSVLNFLLPQEKKMLSMHCSANIGKSGEVAVFFGLSGTGKTTLSADSHRQLIGDDEHVWTEDGIYNIEGGCYAKTINLTKSREPEIWNAIRAGAILENTVFFPDSTKVDYANNVITENTRTSYPLTHMENAKIPSLGGIPKNIFFLTADAFGVLPPVSKLSKHQAMFHFLSGYTSKVAGTEMGVKEPQTTFSACFGEAFLPLHPYKYVELFGQKIEKYNVDVWLINTGWTGGAYGEGERIKLEYTRAIISSVLQGEMNLEKFQQDPVFGLHIPMHCPNVPESILNPRQTWMDKGNYDLTAKSLAKKFMQNIDLYMDNLPISILHGAPIVVW